MRKVIYQLEPVLPQVKEKFPWINNGGCGVFANLLGSELDKLGIKYKIVWIGNNPSKKKEIKKVFNNKDKKLSLYDFNDNGIYLEHFMVKVGRYYIDASGVYKNFSSTSWTQYQLRCFISKDDLERITLTSLGWNKMFDRELIPRVDKEVKKIFKKLA